MINVNLIHERERLRRVGETAGRIAFFAAVAAFALTMVAITLQQTRVRGVRESIAVVRAESAQLQARKVEIDLLQGQIDSKAPLVDLLRGARDSEAKWCNALTQVADAAPPGVSLMTVRSSDTLQPKVTDTSAAAAKTPPRHEGFTITGEATTGDLVSQFIHNLTNASSFGDVYLESVRRRKGAKNVEIFEFDVQALLAKEKPTP
ncbi:MAG: PilN domain-containing protein [Armatimonadetes bacterium]|nr:PilN domain-containing protein [Armatimonadota bacterium]